MSISEDKTFCPVCGYKLSFQPWKGDSASHESCPSCGIEFGYDDVPEASGINGTKDKIYSNWREKWVNDGMHWSSLGLSEPTGWNPKL